MGERGGKGRGGEDGTGMEMMNRVGREWKGELVREARK